MCPLRSEQTRISYLSTGAEDAPVVVCLHGFPDIPRTWAPLTEQLYSAGYRVVRPWLPGYAPSSLEGPFDIPTLARTILSFVDELSPSEPVRIVGHDWGSVITQCALAQRPERFRAAVTLAIPHLLAFETNVGRYPRQTLVSRLCCPPRLAKPRHSPQTFPDYVVQRGERQECLLPRER